MFDKWNRINFKLIHSDLVSFKVSSVEALKDTIGTEMLTYENVTLFWKRYGESRPFPEVETVLARLKKKYRLVLISNIDNDIVKKSPLYKYFNHVFTSEDAGYSYKPQKKIFDFVKLQLGAYTDEILHVASSIRADVRGVVPLGWDMVYVDRTGIAETERELKKIVSVKDLWDLDKILRLVD
jgi:FMN phosphatase YigB (HAD superfamily)